MDIKVSMDNIFLNRDNLCIACREKRIEFAKDDKKWDKDGEKRGYSDFLGGFGEEKKGVDVFIILDSHGGGRKWPEIKPSLEEMNEKLKIYYLKEDPNSFHQMEMRKIIQELEQKKISWYVSDLVKCFVKNKKIKNPDKDNRKIAEDHCFDNYLKKQILLLQPKIILMLGGKVIRIIERNILQKNKIKHGNYLLGKNEFISTHFLYSLFPAQWTADIWIKHGGSLPLLNSIYKILSSKNE